MVIGPVNPLFKISEMGTIGLTLIWTSVGLLTLRNFASPTEFGKLLDLLKPT
jgi:hypothetical protein